MPGLEGSETPLTELAAVSACWIVPLFAGMFLWLRRGPDRRTQGGVFLSLYWNAVGVIVVNAIAAAQGWWSYNFDGPHLVGVPVPLLMGWVVLWGVVAPLLPTPPGATVVGLALLDVITMPLLNPTLELRHDWWIGEALALVAVALPGLVLARWQTDRTHLRGRLISQMALFAVTLLWLGPTLAQGSPASPTISPLLFGVGLAVVGVASLPGVAALAEFYWHRGTPWPWDATERPIISGPYRYVRSPMQLSGVLLLAVMTGLYQQPVLLVAAGWALLWSRLFSESEAIDLAQRWGPAWADVALSQRRWIPSLRPHPGAERATIWIDTGEPDNPSAPGCEPCRGLARFILARQPRAIDVRPASSHPELLMRVRYERADATTFTGTAAVGAALEHLHLGWALIGWMMRLPVLTLGFQAIGDASGFGPRPARSESTHVVAAGLATTQLAAAQRDPIQRDPIQPDPTRAGAVRPAPIRSAPNQPASNQPASSPPPTAQPV